MRVRLPVPGAARLLLGVTVTALAAAAFLTAAPQVSAGTVATPQTMSADPLPTPQVDGIVFSVAIVGSTVYAAGNFDSARPAGAAPGSGEVARTNLLAFDLTTGALLPFSHTITSPAFTSATSPGPFCDHPAATTYRCDAVFRVKASPDGSRIYVVGDFTSVDGQARNRVAAFDTADGSLVAGFAPSVAARVRALAVSSTRVYVGGEFTAVNGVARSRLAAVDLAGVVQPFAPRLDKDAWAAALSADGSRLVVGGRFDTVNTTTIHGLASVYTATGATAPWSSRPITIGNPADPSFVSDLAVDGSTVYVGGIGRSYPAMEGRLAADVATGNLLWSDGCHGDTQAVAVAAGVVYSASHSHDCGPANWLTQGAPNRYQRLVAETADARSAGSLGGSVPGVLPFFPTLDGGPTTSYWKNGTWAVATNGTDLVAGGEFLTVNGSAQQGLTRFVLHSAGAKASGPLDPGPLRVQALEPHALQLSIPAAWDRDGGTLSYAVYRSDNPGTALFTTVAPSDEFERPVLAWTDQSVTPGSSYSYRVRITDADGNVFGTGSSALVTVLGGSAASAYLTDVVRDGAQSWWRLGSAPGSVVQDRLGAVRLHLGLGTDAVADSPPATGGTSLVFSGTSAGWAVSGAPVPIANTVAIELWLRTTTPSGGYLAGFGSVPTDNGGASDRALYLDTTGRVVLATAMRGHQAVVSPARVNDGGWHHVVGQVGPAGTQLFVDGALVAANPLLQVAEENALYPRLGLGSVAGWPAAPAGVAAYSGRLAEVALYRTVLSPAQVHQHWADGALG